MPELHSGCKLNPLFSKNQLTESQDEYSLSIMTRYTVVEQGTNSPPISALSTENSLRVQKVNNYSKIMDELVIIPCLLHTHCASGSLLVYVKAQLEGPRLVF